MDRPNILIFMTDHQRADTVLPEHPCLTPNLDGFARQAVTFTNTFCPSPHCCPSRATFMTGMYPSRHGVWNNICNESRLSRGLASGVRCWSEDLAAAGYRLVWTGKWHVSIDERPADRGWEERTVTATGAELHGQTWDHFRRLAAESEPTERAEGQILRPGYGPYTIYANTGDEGNRHDERVVSEAVEAIGELGRSDRPWALFAGAIGPHDPYYVPGKYLDMYDPDSVPLPPSYADDLSDKPRIYQRMRRTRFGQLSEREVRETIRHFWAYCTYLDDLFGRLLAALEATGRAENTLVLYCSDHGDYCGEHGLFAKGIPCFRGAYHVPAVIRWPAGLASPSRREGAFLSLADFAPTFVELAGGQQSLSRDPKGSAGQSLVPFLRGTRPHDWRDEIHTQCSGIEMYYTQRSVMTADWKYVFNGFDFDELYDLRRDPHEMTNLADRAEFEPVKRDLCRRLWRFACREGDEKATNAYITVGLAPYGPAEAFRE